MIYEFKEQFIPQTKIRLDKLRELGVQIEENIDMQPESRLPTGAYNNVVSETKAPYAWNVIKA